LKKFPIDKKNNKENFKNSKSENVARGLTLRRADRYLKLTLPKIKPLQIILKKTVNKQKNRIYPLPVLKNKGIESPKSKSVTITELIK